MSFKRLLRTCGILILLAMVFMTLEPARAEEEHTSVEKNESGENGNSEAKDVNDERNAIDGKTDEESNASEGNTINKGVDGNGMNISEEQIRNMKSLHNLSSDFNEHIVKLETDIQGLKDNETFFMTEMTYLQKMYKEQDVHLKEMTAKFPLFENGMEAVKGTQNLLNKSIESEIIHRKDSIESINQRIDDHKRDQALAQESIQRDIASVQKHISDNDHKFKQLFDDLKTSLDMKETETEAKISILDADLKYKFELLNSRITQSEEKNLKNLSQSKEETDQKLDSVRQQISDMDIKWNQLLDEVKIFLDTKLKETETKITSLDAEFKSQFEVLNSKLTKSENLFLEKLTQSKAETDRRISTATEKMHADMENHHGKLKTEMDTIRNLLKQEIGHVFGNVSQHKALLDIIYPNTFHRGCTHVTST